MVLQNNILRASASASASESASAPASPLHANPFLSSPCKGNDVGNAFVFAPDMLATLLESLPADAFRPHMGAVSRHVEWLQQNQVLSTTCSRSWP